MIYGRWDSLPSGTQITPTKLEMRNNRFWPSRHYPWHTSLTDSPSDREAVQASWECYGWWPVLTMGPMRKPERETWPGKVGEEILEEGAVPTEQWRVGTIWRDRKKWERNSKRGYQVHEWRHTSRDKHAGPLEFILDRAIAVEEGSEEPSWRGKVNSDRGKTQMAGKVPLNLLTS